MWELEKSNVCRVCESPCLSLGVLIKRNYDRDEINIEIVLTLYLPRTFPPYTVSNHVPNHVMSKSHDQSPSNGKRKRSSEEEEDVWTEHTSSTGRVYFYNKKLDKSQWERPKGAVKRCVASGDRHVCNPSRYDVHVYSCLYLHCTLCLSLPPPPPPHTHTHTHTDSSLS